ncbi:hypothetical protein LTR35_002623 [Friedmanniomyces endolithicus]|uniref:Uncharacterized protein n=1 Tax=Friedmanniomyces endolithicus TaxID=329885 RepID=A0AAN6FSA7_9PEZI|nr:hypothetical protein LTR35_002623 [Friedmanniomyces endolithicus]KAK0323574.1 hypothetical protein LTR82_005321 [Friedmanniomyces endolithicus]KAK1019505.1 hypothetical protein LTR54_000147 [Friedmanniomyces endolithicus]
MKFTTIISVLIPTFASATLTYDITQALAPGEFENVNYEVFSEIIEPCVFPPALGGHGTCSFADLAKARPLIQGTDEGDLLGKGCGEMQEDDLEVF